MKKTIFVVDDIAINLAIAKSALEDDYIVITLSSIKRMFSVLEKKLPALILLDIEMPEMDGFEALNILKSDPRFASVPVIFLTGSKGADIRHKCLEVGAVDFISKPITNIELLGKVNAHTAA